jgi:superfamily II DNA or RNA helicase
MTFVGLTVSLPDEASPDMPKIYDNIAETLLSDLDTALGLSTHADFCVGYFNLRGWRHLDARIANWPGGFGAQCRLLVGMHPSPREELHAAFHANQAGGMDNALAIRLKRRLAEEFHQQLTLGVPTNEDEAGLQRLLSQLRTGQLVVKLFLRHPLHAKLYLAFRQDPINPITGFLGSSNLTFSGLLGQGELNIDVLDRKAAAELAEWFEARWTDRWCLDITADLIAVLEQSWAREQAIPPHHIYLKMAYHLSQEAREGLAEFRLPRQFRGKLFAFQEQAVRIAARHLSRRGGVLLGDVVGLGKTLMATALVKTFEEMEDLETLILCPLNLEPMWRDYQDRYGIRGKVLSTSRVATELPDLRRYRLVVLDESHNFRNREGKTWRLVRDYIERNDSRCILLSATPYNKSYADLAGQLGLFLDGDADLGLRPEQLLRQIGGELAFTAIHNVPVRSLSAFALSPYPDDWRDLMSRYLVRRTRSFIMKHHAETDDATGRPFLRYPDGRKALFPKRTPRTAAFVVDRNDPNDTYARLYSGDVVGRISSLRLPRYGLGNYLAATPAAPPSQAEARVIRDLSRAGKRLMGFCRTNLFKRLESSGEAFILSLRRHVLRNALFIHALESGLPLPVGGVDPAELDTRFTDGDDPGQRGLLSDEETYEEDLSARAADAYARLQGQRVRWVAAHLFLAQDLLRDLRADNAVLESILADAGPWRRETDAKLTALVDLLKGRHRSDKVLIFTQFADTARYLGAALEAGGVTACAVAVGGGADTAQLAWRFSPVSNERQGFAAREGELRVLVATDVLSEGQNLQDAHVVVNYDLPWAIIRLIQRVGRVDRIGQTSDEILAYSFLPADGLDQIIALRGRLMVRLRENAEVVGTDETFFEGEMPPPTLNDLYTEKAGVLDDEDGAGEVDLASYCHQIWMEADPADRAAVERLPAVAYSAKVATGEPGALVFVRTSDGSSALSRWSAAGEVLTESPLAILKAAECTADEPARPRAANHHDLVRLAVEAAERDATTGGRLGGPRSIARRSYERLRRHLDTLRAQPHDLLAPSEAEIQAVQAVMNDLFARTLRTAARNELGAALRDRSDPDFAALAIALRDEGRLCLDEDEADTAEAGPVILCSLGLVQE